MTPDASWRRFRETGDPAALGALFDAVSPELFRVALSLTSDAASAEDALQETWLVAMRSAEGHDPSRRVMPWLVGILRHKIQEWRRAARPPEADRVRKRKEPADPADVSESADDAVHARAALDALPEPYREVAVLRWRYGLLPEVRRTLAGGERAELRLVRPSPIAMTISARDKAGRPRSGVTLRVELRGGYALTAGMLSQQLNERTWTTDADGRVTIDLMPGSYAMFATSGAESREKRLEADATKPATGELVFSAQPATISGRVLERGTGLPVAGRPIHATSDKARIGDAMTNAEGRFVLTGMPAGKVYLSVAGTALADPANGGRSRADPASPYPYAFIDVELVEGETRSLSLTLPRVKGPEAETRPVQVHVKVRDDAGPASDATVGASVMVDGAKIVLEEVVKSDAAGNVTLSLIAGDRYDIWASRGSHRARASVSPGTSDVELVLVAK